MKPIQIAPVEISPGVTVSSVTISAIVPHDFGLTIYFDQGFSVIFAYSDAGDGYGNFSMDSSLEELVETIINSIPTAIANKFGEVSVESEDGDVEEE